MEQSRLRFSLEQKVVLAVVICVLVPVMGMGAYFSSQGESVLRDKARETLTNDTFRRTAQVEAWMAERLREATRWSSSFVVFESVEALRGPGEQPRARADLRDYLESVLGHYRVYESLFVCDLDGNVLAATAAEELEPWARDLLREQAGGTGAVISPVRRSDRLERPTLLLFHVIQGRSDRPIGFFGQRLDLRELASTLEGGPGNGTGFWLLDHDGGVLIRYGRVVDSPGSQRFPARLTEAVGEGDLEGVGDSLWGIRKLEGALDGYVAATVPASLAYRPLTESRLRLMKVIVPTVLLICVLAWLLGRRMVAPIQALSRGAQRVAAGDLGVDLPVRGNDEVGELTLAFNDMVREIRDSHNELQARKEELEAANAKLEAANRKLDAQAKTDPLTGIYNRRQFQEVLEAEIERAERGGWPLSLLFIDLDHFKQYNDRWGHLEGDAELRRVAAQIIKTIRSTDTAYRYGGEEFAALLPSCPKDQAVTVAEKVCRAVRVGTQKPGRFGGSTTVSIGVATFPDDGRVSRGLVDTADAALYAAKAAGRNCVVPAGAAGTASGGHPEADKKAARD